LIQAFWEWKNVSERVAIILAAGISSRMKTQVPKVLHEVCGRPMLAYVLEACRAAGAEKIYIVVGCRAERIKEQFAGDKDVVWVRQDEQKGTAHAVLCCREHLADFEGETLVICGDMPLVEVQTLKALIEKRRASGAALVLATAVLEEATGYGRIKRDKDGNIAGIIEHNDCTAEELAIKEVNPSYYLFDNKVLFETAAKVGSENAKNEYYLTDAVSLILDAGHKVEAVASIRPEEAMGVNSRQQLGRICKVMQGMIQQRLMEEGVTIVDADNTWIGAGAKIGRDTVIEPFTYIRGGARIGQGCRVGPFVYLDNNAVIEDGLTAGPEGA
jgi:bifunctional UDP-N-acetylglucosamine pyrophosphorylase/glucosamine-1-phosphate N-acetyltransferase